MGGPSAPRSTKEGADTIVWLAPLPDVGRFETCRPRFSNLLMAHDFWSQVFHRRELIGVGVVLAQPPDISRLLSHRGDIGETGNPDLPGWSATC